jgi:UrcA family protein
MIMSAVAFAATALPLAPAVAQPDDYYGSYDSHDNSPPITVTGPHQRTVGRSASGAPIRESEASMTVASGAPIRESEASMTVDYSDLDLRSSLGRDLLNTRVDAAARDACNALDDAFGVADPALTEPADCRADARRRAQGQVREAIYRANYYRY